MNRLRCLLLTLCVIALLATPMFAQKSTGTLSGVVTDPSGAVVPNAPVTVTELATNTTRSISTDSQGVYSVPELTPGTYKVTVKPAASYKEAVVNNVEIHVASTTNVNIKLQLGKMTETVEVQANAVQVQTDSAQLGEVVDATQVSELPLNGRNFMGLTQLAPGVSTGNSYDGTGKGLKGGVDFSVNGNAVTNNLYLVDGANNNDRGSNRTILIYPSVDSIAEFKMLQNSYGPEYGQAAGSVISMVTKGGTNQFHGSVFYAGRNDALDAWDYFAKGIGEKGKLRRNDYGFSIGGPVLKDKLFFFYSQEWNKEIRGVSNSICVPSLAERAGDFTNPSCGASVPHDIIPSLAATPTSLKSISKIGQDFIAWYPAPNSGTSTWNYSDNTQYNWRQENARVDYNLTKTNTLMGRYTQDNWDAPNADGHLGWGDSPFPTLNSTWSQPSKMIIGKLTSQIGATMINDAEFSYSNNRINITVAGSNPGLMDAFTADAPTLYPESIKNSHKGVPSLNGGWGGFAPYGGWGAASFWVQAPWNNALDMYSVRDDISKVMANHTFKAGFLADFNGKNEDSGSPNSERLGIGSTNIANLPGNKDTGNGLVNVMEQGLIFNLSENSVNVRALTRWRDYEAYFGDTWKARKNLTVEYGIRYSYLPSPYQANNDATSFNPALYNSAIPFTAGDACNGMWTVPGTDPCGHANTLYGTHYSKAAFGPNKYLSQQNYHLFAPRLGLAWDPTGTGNWAIRAGGGQFFQRDRVSPWYVIMNQAPFSVTVNNVQRTIDGTTATLAGAGGSPTGGRSPSATMPNSWQWNVAVEHLFAKETALQVAYVGNTAIHQLMSYDINAANPNQNVDCNLQLSGGGAYHDFGQISTWKCGSFGLGNLPSGQPIYNQLLRPYGNYGSMAYWNQSGQATYHALQTVFKTKYKRSQFTAAYTWSHSIGNVQLDDSSGGAGGQSFTYYGLPGLDRGNTPINRPHIFVANGTYFFPELKGQNALVRNIAGGWEMSGITQATSGHSITVTQGFSENANLVVGGTPTTGGATYNASSLLGGLSYVNTRSLMTGSNCNAGMNGPNIINPAAFTLVGYNIGQVNANTAPRGYCFGPHFVNTDFSIDKNWKLTERFNMQFRLDLFDAFNHPNMAGGAVQAGLPGDKVNCGAADATGHYQPCSPTNSIISTQIRQGLGGVTGTVGSHGREMQYSLRITF